MVKDDIQLYALLQYMLKRENDKMAAAGGVRTPTVRACARIFKRLWSPGIDSKASIPPAYVSWRAGTITLFLLGA
jgi:hypothetical protein